MKITILGSCLSGMALAIRLFHSRHEVEICLPETGLEACNSGVLFNSVSCQSLATLGVDLQKWLTPLKGGQAQPHSNQGSSETGNYLFSVDSLRLHQEIQKCLGENLFRFNARFSHFEPKAGYHIQSARFKDGTESKADLFVGADGVQSVVRKSQVPGPALSLAKTRQISGISNFSSVESVLGKRVLSYRFPQEAGELVIFPLDAERAAWRLQLDARVLQGDPMNSLEDCRRRVFDLSRDCPREWQPIFENEAITSIQSSKCSDRRLPHLFHKDNVVLIGKAAHPTLPDLLSGVDSDLEDALLLSDLLDELEKGHFASLDICLTEFIRQRRPLLNSRIRKARAHQKRVLSVS